MKRPLTLPGLQAKLDLLGEGNRVSLSHADYEMLFGAGEGALDRLVHFAKGHRCTVVHTPREVVFFKEPPKAG